MAAGTREEEAGISRDTVDTALDTKVSPPFPYRLPRVLTSDLASSDTFHHRREP